MNLKMIFILFFITPKEEIMIKKLNQKFCSLYKDACLRILEVEEANLIIQGE